MRAKIRQYGAGAWRTVAVSTEPLQGRLEGESTESFDFERWALSLPPLLVDGKSTPFLKDPEGWLSKMAKMNYTRITAQILS